MEGPIHNSLETVKVEVNKGAFEKMLTAQEQHSEFNTNRTRRELVDALYIVLLNARKVD